ncbi:uncharacterized protein LOC134542157 [Bacillus rossius redtenbacheri]|uniref:uncharacterized protein LOC134542157 n=1 Tax=Bacillus rossius redtenbacheri TaxID=93214 RepID=UPI002FDE18F3
MSHRLFEQRTLLLVPTLGCAALPCAVHRTTDASAGRRRCIGGRMLACLQVWYILGLLGAASCLRTRRYLVYPEGSEVELAVGFDLPVEVSGGEVGLGMELEVTYELPSNASQLSQGYVSYAKRAARLPSRWQLYLLLERLLRRVGLDGRACLLRAVCEASGSHMVRGQGLSAEVLHIFLTPSATDEEKGAETQVRREYSSAEAMGDALQVDCAVLYPECSLSLLDLLSHV